MNELTAKDLMVGDWVLYNPNVFIEDEYELTKDPYPTKISCGEDIDLAFEDCYSPIPITAQILEKNGFENPTLNDPELINYVFKASFEYKSSVPNGEVLRVNFYDGDEWDFYALLGERESSDCGEQYEYIIIIKYLHELQHALRLAGIDITIEL